MNELAVSKIDPDVGRTGQVGFEENQVARLFLTTVDLAAYIVLHVGGSRQIDAVSSEHVLGEGRTVDSPTGCAAHQVRGSQIAVRRGSQTFESLTSTRS